MDKRKVRRLSSQEKFQIVAAIVGINDPRDGKIRLRPLKDWVSEVARITDINDIPESSMRQFLKVAEIPILSVKGRTRAPRVSSADKIRSLRRILSKIIQEAEMESCLSPADIKFLNSSNSGAGLAERSPETELQQRRFDERG